jgi:hypothetical protein
MLLLRSRVSSQELIEEKLLEEVLEKSSPIISSFKNMKDDIALKKVS